MRLLTTPLSLCFYSLCFIAVDAIAQQKGEESDRTLPGLSKPSSDPQRKVNRNEFPKAVPQRLRTQLNSWSESLTKNHPQIKNDLDKIISDPVGGHQQLYRLVQRVDPTASSALVKAMKSEDPLHLTAIRSRCIRAHLELERVIRLVRQSRFDQAKRLVDAIPADQLIDPVTRLFYSALCDFQLVEIKQAKTKLDRLQLHRERLPVRYRVMIRSLLAEIQQIKPDSLGELSRLMRDAGRRQALSEVNKEAFEQENTIVKKLDRMIKKLEDEQQTSRARSRSNAGPGKNSQQPNPARLGKGGSNSKGEVDPRSDHGDGKWGRIDLEQKTIAVANLVRDLPPHFRSLIEAYFERLAEGDIREK